MDQNRVDVESGPRCGVRSSSHRLTAGLTIVQERARLSPELAEDIIFLHDVWPVIDKFVAEDKIINID